MAGCRIGYIPTELHQTCRTMATLLCTWELGSQLGHLANLRLPIERAVRAGHRVVLAARELHRVHEVLGGLPLTLLPAPFRQQVPMLQPGQVLCYSQLIEQQAIPDANALANHLQAWRNLFDLVQPDAVLFEHSPTALLAARGARFAKVLVGNGFTIPPTQAHAGAPWAAFPNTPRDAATCQKLLQEESRIAALVQQALDTLGWPAIAGWQTLYQEVDARWMLTWPQLDHFGTRDDVHYLGVATVPGHAPPAWPQVGAHRVFGYLRPFPGLEVLLQALQRQSLSVLLYAPLVPLELRQRYQSASLRFADQPVDMGRVAQEADWVISHGNHSTLAGMALAGLPQLLVPLHQEHLFMALRMMEHAAAAMVYQDQAAYDNAVVLMQERTELRQGARTLAQGMVTALKTDDPSGWIDAALRGLLRS